MRIYSVTALLVFSFIAYVFLQDDESCNDDIQSWLFIAFAAVIWPITLPNIVRKVIIKWLSTQNTSSSLQQKTEEFSVTYIRDTKTQFN